MPDTIDISLYNRNLEACLKSVNNIGSTTFKNICTGEATAVNWGIVDWALALLVVAFFGSVIYAMIKMARS